MFSLSCGAGRWLICSIHHRQEKKQKKIIFLLSSLMDVYQRPRECMVQWLSILPGRRTSRTEDRPKQKGVSRSLLLRPGALGVWHTGFPQGCGAALGQCWATSAGRKRQDSESDERGLHLSASGGLLFLLEDPPGLWGGGSVGGGSW